MSKIISTDGFLWLDVTEKAKEIYNGIYFYTEDDVIEMDAELICKNFLDVEMKFISEE